MFLTFTGLEIGSKVAEMHTTTLLEPTFALRRVLPEDLRLDVAFFGALHPSPEPLLHEALRARAEWRSISKAFESTRVDFFVVFLSPFGSFWRCR